MAVGRYLSATSPPPTGTYNQRDVNLYTHRRCMLVTCSC